jgi:MFS-type transporter involved in bile tolerance (Atg22 family)
VLLLSILIVVVNVLSTLIVAVLADYIKSGLVISVELNRHEIITLVANLGK